MSQGVAHTIAVGATQWVINMISVIRLDFDHDSSDKAVRFHQYCKSIIDSGTFDVEPLVLEQPVFSYGHDQLEGLSERLGTRDAIVFLSEICCYSFALIQSHRGGTLLGDFSVFSEYDSIESLLESPRIVGYSVSASETLSLVDPDCHVLSMLPAHCFSELVDDDTGAPNPELIDVKRSRGMNGGAIYAYRVLRNNRYFSSMSSCDWPIYVIEADTVDLMSALNHYYDESLTEHLLSLAVPFATLNDNHQDDYFAVSYRKPFWQIDDDQMAFVA